MKIKQIILWISGIISAVIMTGGLALLIFSTDVAWIAGTVVICLSLATGLVLSDPVSIIGLIFGILMLFVPGKLMGGIILGVGLVCAAVILAIGLKKKKKTEAIV